MSTFLFWLENDLGFFQIIDQKYLVFFGKKNTDLSQLQKAFPHLKFVTIKQTHSDICISSQGADGDEQTADAQFTNQKNLALVIKTADCIPALAFDPVSEKILAVHAGWRGIENQIISKSLVSANLHQIYFFTGPHILQKSFEVDQDVFDRLLLRAKSYQLSFLPAELFEKKENKFFLNLMTLVQLELKSVNLEILTQDHLQKDTVTDPVFNSYRRDKETRERNLSFIAKLK